MLPRWPLLLLLAGCTVQGIAIDETGDTVDVEDPVDTDVDDEEDEDVEGVLDQLGDCEKVEANGRIDIERGCADGGCVGMTFDALVGALGRGECQTYESYPGWVGCWWDVGISTSFLDEDYDGLPDREDRNDGLYVYTPYPGSTEDGLGVGASMSCFVEDLGYPDSAQFQSSDEGFLPNVFYWEQLGLYVYDEYVGNTAYGQDGTVDYLFLQGDPDY